MSKKLIKTFAKVEQVTDYAISVKGIAFRRDVTKESLKSHFERFGPVHEVQICRIFQDQCEDVRDYIELVKKLKNEEVFCQLIAMD